MLALLCEGKAALEQNIDAANARPIPGVQVAFNPFKRGVQLGSVTQLSSMYRELEGHVVMQVASQGGQCGYFNFAQQCAECVICCLLWLLGGGGGGGPTFGDPVNLANMQEEYKPAPDLTVYNPNGPAVTWSRMYHSLRGADIAYQDADFGNGWSHPYNVFVYEPNLAYTTLPSGDTPQGMTPQIPITGTNSPVTTGATWEIQLSGTVIATSVTPNGWNVTVPQNSVGIGGSGTATNMNVTVPITATVASGYEARYLYVSGPGGPGGGITPGGSSGPYSAPFSVILATQPDPTTTKYIIFDNGARVGFTISGGALPTASTPTVSCVTSGSGYPLLIQCHYNATLQNCYYTVTFSDQTQWTLTPSFYTSNDQLFYNLTHLQDRVGNGLDFVYGAPAATAEQFMTYGFPLLASIHDSSTSNALLTLLRDSHSCVIEAQDCYGRSVYYANGAYSSSGSLGTYAHNELTQVSQIVATGTGASSAPMRYQYDYGE